MDEVLEFLTEKVPERKAMLAFAIDYTDDLCKVINFSQQRTIPVVVSMALEIANCHEKMKELVCKVYKIESDL